MRGAPGRPPASPRDARSLRIAELCAAFYRLGWASGTGGSISIREGNRVYMAPSGVQKERIEPRDVFVIDSRANLLYSPAHVAGDVAAGPPRVRSVRSLLMPCAAASQAARTCACPSAPPSSWPRTTAAAPAP